MFKKNFFSFYLLIYIIILNAICSIRMNKEIGGSLLDLIKKPEEEITLKNNNQNNENFNLIETNNNINNIFLSLGENNNDSTTNKFDIEKDENDNNNNTVQNYEIKSPNNKLIHSAYSDSYKSQKWGLVTLILFGTSFLILRSGYNFLKNMNKFFAKGVKSLSNQILLLFISLSIFIICYTYGAFDSIIINWEYIIAIIAIFIVIWIFYNFFLLLFALSVTIKWRELENNATSFLNLKQKINQESKNSNYISAFEYLLLKRYFFIPLFPVLKCSSLKPEMKFHVYLEECLLKKLRHFFKLSWTSWISTIIVIMFWNVFVWNMKIFPSTVFVFLSPLIGIAVTFFIYTYIKSIYRQVVVSINNENLNDFKDFDYYKNDIFESMGFPKYLNDIINDEEKLNKLKENKYTFHEHLNNRPTNLYENLIIFGHSGLYFLLNLIQCINVLFICWQIAIFGHFAEDIAIAYTNIMYLFLICCTIAYVFVQLYLTILTLKWLTIIDSIEMNRNEKCLKKMINKHIKRAGELSNSIFLAFKKIYFNMIFNKNETPGNEKEKFDEKQNLIDNESLNEEFEINNNDNNRKSNEKDKEEFKLVYENLKDILKLNYNRFKKFRNDNTIDIKNELQPFLKSCGNFLNEKEINFLLHLLQNSSNYNGTLNLDQLIFLCGCILHFQAQKPSEIIKYVIDQYYKKNPQYYKGKTMKWENIELFLNYYDYFTKNEIDFIKEQCDYIGNEFTLDGFISCVLSPSQFYAN